MQEHGFLALYRGLAPTLISSFPKAGIRFSSNAYFKKMLMDENGKLTPGSCVGALSLVCWCGGGVLGFSWDLGCCAGFGFKRLVTW